MQGTVDLYFCSDISGDSSQFWLRSGKRGGWILRRRELRCLWCRASCQSLITCGRTRCPEREIAIFFVIQRIPKGYCQPVASTRTRCVATLSAAARERNWRHSPETLDPAVLCPPKCPMLVMLQSLVILGCLLFLKMKTGTLAFIFFFWKGKTENAFVSEISAQFRNTSTSRQRNEYLLVKPFWKLKDAQFLLHNFLPPLHFFTIRPCTDCQGGGVQNDDDDTHMTPSDFQQRTTQKQNGEKTSTRSHLRFSRWTSESAYFACKNNFRNQQRMFEPMKANALDTTSAQLCEWSCQRFYCGPSIFAFYAKPKLPTDRISK